MKSSKVCLYGIVLLTLGTGPHLSGQVGDFYPGAVYDRSIPTLQQVIGHGWGERISSHAETVQYLQALAEASSRASLIEYGQSWGGRKLYYLVIASEANQARLEEIREGNRQLADPRSLSDTEAETLISTLPSVTWLAYGVHGNEISSTDAALLTAYHLLAARDDSVVRDILDHSVVIIDPLQNPDGRDRFVNYQRQTLGRWPDPSPAAAERNEDWPGGRSNHYLFDLNRDWFAQTQPETQGRVRAYLEWHPQVFVDLHEMGSDTTYYFAPPANPLNPGIPPIQREWLERFGHNVARWFDRHRIDYFTREVFDAFYPGYGEGWPTFHGSVGMTFEQASSRGLVVRRRDGSLLHYRDGVRHHFLSSLATAEANAVNRENVLRYFYEYRRTAIEEGTQETVKEYLFPPGSDPVRTARLMAKLMSQGIEVRQAESEFLNPSVRDYLGGAVGQRTFPAGTFVVSLAQPAKRLAKTLLDRHTPMDEDFIGEEKRRRALRESSQIFDLTGWSLPLLFGVEAYKAEALSQSELVPLVQPDAMPPGGRLTGKANLAYLIRWGTQAAAQALAQLHLQQIRVFAAHKGFRQQGVDFPAGTLVVRVRDNPPELHQMIEKIASETGTDVIATDTAWVEEGINLGSNHVRFLERPKIAMAYKQPTRSTSSGWTRFLMERQYGYPVTLIDAQQISSADLSDFNVLILPNGPLAGYRRLLGESGAARLKSWVEQGGTLISFGDTTAWLCAEGVELLSSQRENRSAIGSPEKTSGEEGKENGEETSMASESEFDYEQAIQPDEELPGRTPGAILRVTVDAEHWLGFGFPAGGAVIVDSNNIFTPIKLDKGRNVAVYESQERLLLSGFTWDDSRRQLARKAYLMHQPRGRGHVVAFAEDPNFRAFQDGMNIMFLNAVFFGLSR